MKFSDVVDVRLVCETGSLRKAAEVLGITQPTLSTRIAHLEDQLGTALFDRSHGKSRPTDLALFIAQRAVALTNEADRLEREVRRLSSGKSGTVRIGLGPAMSKLMASRIASRILARSPGLTLEMISGPTHLLFDDLARRAIDLLVCERPDVTCDMIASELLVESDMVAVARPEHPLCSTPPRGLRELLDYPFATSFVRHDMLAALRVNHGIDLEAQSGRVVCSDYDMLVRVVLETPQLVSVGARLAFAAEIESGALAVIDLKIPLENVVFIHTNRDAYPLPAVASARDMIRQLFAELLAGRA